MRSPRSVVLVAVLALAGLLAGCGFVNAGKNDDELPAVESPSALTVTSSAFADGAPIPEEFTCKGANTSPPLAWAGVPGGARSVALVVDDPDAPNGTYMHWVVYNIDPTQSAIAAGEVPKGVAGDQQRGRRWATPARARPAGPTTTGSRSTCCARR